MQKLRVEQFLTKLMEERNERFMHGQYPKGISVIAIPSR